METLRPGVYLEEIQGCPALEEFEEGLGGKQGAFKQGFVRFQPSGQVLPRCYARLEKEISELEVREDDVWISSFPKCGTTWTQEMVWNIVNSLDIKTAKSTSLEERVPFLELTALTEPSNIEGAEQVAGTGTLDSLQQVRQLASPRVIKTHLSADMLPAQVLQKKVKVIYVTRNPRDAVVSFHNHWRILEGYRGTFATFLAAFLGDVCGYYTPFLQHILGYWAMREQPQVLFLTYEEMKADLPGVVGRVAAFLGRQLTVEQVCLLSDHLSFNNMKNNAAVNKEDVVVAMNKMHGSEEGKFMRKGQVGDWKNHLTPDQVGSMEEWEEEQLEGTGLHFVYQL